MEAGVGKWQLIPSYSLLVSCSGIMNYLAGDDGH